jgi:hypothetical protein
VVGAYLLITKKKTYTEEAILASHNIPQGTKLNNIKLKQLCIKYKQILDVINKEKNQRQL